MQGISGSGVVGSGVGAGVGTGVGAAEDGKVKEDRMFETELLSALEGTISLGDARICPFIPLTVKPAFVVASMVVYFRFSLMPKFIVCQKIVAKRLLQIWISGTVCKNIEVRINIRSSFVQTENNKMVPKRF